MLSPAEIAEVKRAAVAYEAGLAGTSDETVKRMVGALATAYPSHRISAKEAQAKLALYVRGLRDLPQDALEAGFAEVLKTSTFFPAIAEIRQAAEPYCYERRFGLLACKRLTSRHERDWRPERVEEPLTEAEIAQLNLDMKALGLRRRFRVDGTSFELGAGDVDPVQPEPVAEAA